MAAQGCRAARGKLEALLDERLPERRARALRAHLERCAACGAEYAALERLRGRLRALPAEPLPADFALQLHRRLVAASPAAVRRPWGAILAFPAATALAGFLAAAVLAQPMLRPRSLGASGAAAAANALERASGTEGRVAIGSVTPALFPVPSTGAPAGSGGGETPGSSSGGSSAGAMSAQSLTAAANIPFASGSPENAVGAPSAVSMTLLASSPQEALATLSDLVVGSGGRVVTTFLGSAGASASSAAAAAPAGGAPAAAEGSAGGPQPVATVDAVVPEGAVPGYDQAASGLGTLLAVVDDVPASAPATAPVRLIVTILSVAAAPAAATSASQTSPVAAGRTAAASAARHWQERVLLDAARAAPWAAGALAAALLAWGADRLLRRGRWA